MTQARNLYEIAVPIKGFASLYLTHSWDGEVQGLKAVPAADRPYVPFVFFAFRIMVGIALLLIALAFTAPSSAGAGGCSRRAGSSSPAWARRRWASWQSWPAGR